VRVQGTRWSANRALFKKGKRMAWKDWDDRDYWADESKCVVCGISLGRSQALICSATCEDISTARERLAFQHDQEGNYYV